MVQEWWTSTNNIEDWITSKKIMLSVWWDWKGVVVFELLPRNRPINLDVYCRQQQIERSCQRKTNRILLLQITFSLDIYCMQLLPWPKIGGGGLWPEFNLFLDLWILKASALITIHQLYVHKFIRLQKWDYCHIFLLCYTLMKDGHWFLWNWS